MSNDKQQSPEQRLQNEFNRWADEGEGAKMERHHLDITEKTIRLMNLRPGERVLDLGCGSGWATRLLGRLVGEGPEGFGQVVGVDVQALKNLLVAIVEPIADLVAQDFEVSEDRLHRRAKFMRQVGERLHMQSLLPINRLNSGAESVPRRGQNSCNRSVPVF